MNSTKIAIIDQFYPLRPERIILGIARNIGIKNIIHWLPHIISRPKGLRAIPLPPPRIWIEIMHETNPVRVHQLRQSGVGAALIGKRVDGNRWISNAKYVVENECDLLEMRHSRDWFHAGWDRVEAVAVCGDICTSPRLACEAPSGNESGVAIVGGCTPELSSKRSSKSEVAA